MLRVADFFADSDTGRARRANEDAFFAHAPVFAVADGMGGAQAGEVASRTVVDCLRENDRSATGYLTPQEFQDTVSAFFAQPEFSVRGWEPAACAQARIVGAVEKVISLAPEGGDIVIVGHGGTGTLLYCYLGGLAIARRYDQPATNGGNWFAFSATDLKLRHDGWRSIDDATLSS